MPRLHRLPRPWRCQGHERHSNRGAGGVGWPGAAARRRAGRENTASQISADTVRLWETIAAQESRNVDELLREVGSTYFPPAKPPTPGETAEIVRKEYQRTAEAQAAALARAILTR